MLKNIFKKIKLNVKRNYHEYISLNWKQHINLILKILIILFIIIVILFPLYYLISFSFLTDSQSLERGSVFVTNNFNFSNYGRAFGEGFWIALGYSLALTFIIVAFRMLILIPAAYGISRMSKYWRLVWYSFFLIMASIPEITLHLGYYRLAVNFGWSSGSNILNALIFPNMFSIFITMMFVQGFESIPEQKIKMAKIDNLSLWKKIKIVYLPHLNAPIWISIIFSTIYSWNSFIWPMIILSNTEINLLSVWFKDIGKISTGGNLQNITSAGAVLSILPLLLTYIIFSKKINKVTSNFIA
ncbi:multiple sugar transport system permease protein [Mycoplasma testudineum]|uniref:Multiple sugar transport system permease protein n=1 Tax=Mycoplasma testudineum TaxID=244584 RepID=A0A4R6IFD9_9MOLU|nr:carbohydrate ABC transporter permease [Mycoplasma testudineum]OYD26893.1 hypothetical protein CG473_00955 [Mycoplasma testudineum]TDO20441.1 multiple sugar transport system permease protein [Mycoplasma testudineum]